MEHRSLIWGLDDGWMGDGISSLGDNLSSDNVTCGRQDVDTLVCRIGIACISFCLCLCICICLCLWLVIKYSHVTCGRQDVNTLVCRIGIACIPFCLCLCICICLCLWLVIRYSQVTCGGSKICSPWCTIGIARIPFITTWWAGGGGGPPAGLWNIIWHLKSHKLIVITPGTLFIVSMIILIIVVVNVIKERMWRGFDCYQVWWALDTPVILLLIPSNSNLNWIYPTYASSW